MFAPSAGTNLVWLNATLAVGVLSVLILYKERLPNRQQIIIGAVLAVLVGIIRPLSGVVTFLSFLAASRILEIREGQIKFFRRPLWLSLLFGVGLGLVLGFVNLFLSGAEFAFNPSFFALIVALTPGISEEICFRLFVYAGCIYLLGEHPRGRKADLWLYFVMIVPHVLLHFATDQFFTDGMFTFDFQIAFSILILSLLFGLPMTLLMRKRDVTSAIITHTIVDFIRFMVYGIPL